jgi:hypothetical protein
MSKIATNDLQYYFYGCSVISVTKFITLASSQRDYHAKKFKSANLTAFKNKTILAIRLIYFKSANYSANVLKNINCKQRQKHEPYWSPTFEAKKAEAILDILKLKKLL